jgi:hypothetical protein
MLITLLGKSIKIPYLCPIPIKPNSMKLQVVTLEEVQNSPRSLYNHYEWIKMLNLYNGAETIFYKDAEKEEKYYAVYRADGLLFFKEISYSSCLSSSGFKRVLISKETNVCHFLEFTDGKGNWGLLENTQKNRKQFRGTEVILTNEF